MTFLKLLRGPPPWWPGGGGIFDIYLIFIQLHKFDTRNLYTHPSPDQESTNSERKLVCGDWHPSENTDHPTYFLF